jgi:hypothetical protein
VIVDRVARFISEPCRADFNDLALAAFAFQYQKIEPYRRLCNEHRAEPGRITHWTQIPPVPALAYKSLRLESVPATETFRSSGTTGADRSVHYHGFAQLYRQTIDATFPRACLRNLPQPPMLSLIPSQQQLPDSSLSFMVDHVLKTFGAPDSRVAFASRGVDARQARSFLASRQRDGRPLLILSTAFALLQLLEALEMLNLRFRLPAGSRIFETGGFKGRTRVLERSELLSRITERLGLPHAAVVREYGMTELTSQFYTDTLAEGDPDLFVPPPWVRVRALDPFTLEELAAGRTGLICILDLANLSSAIHLVTEDLGVTETGGFRLTGRAAGAELRGCSLTVEELETRP